MGTLNQRGSVLILSLWIMTLMLLTASSLAYRALIEFRLTRYGWDEIRLIEQAKEAAFECLLHPAPQKGAAYGLEDESARINLNDAPAEVLRALFADDPAIADSILDWRTPAARGEDYAAFGYAARHGPFKSVEELLLVKHMTPVLFRQVRGYLTVYSKRGVNINTAQEPVLAALGLTDSLVRKILLRRATGAEEFSAASDVIASLKKDASLSEEETSNLSALLRQSRLKTQSETMHLHWVARLPDSPVRRQFDIVITGGPGNGRILSWREMAG